MYCSLLVTDDLNQHGKVDSFLHQEASTQQQAQMLYQPNTREPFESGTSQSTFFTMSSSSAHDDFLSAPTSNQSQASFTGSKIPTTNTLPSTMGPGPWTPLGPSSGVPHSFSPQATSDFQISPQPLNNLGKISPTNSGTLPQSSTQPAVSCSQTPPQPASGWAQTPPKPSASLSQMSSQPSASWTQTSPQASASESQTPPTSSSSSLSTDSSITSLQSMPHHYQPSSPQMQSAAPPVVTHIDPVQPHWFYRKGNSLWLPFSYVDSECLEQALKTPASGDRIVPTDGGRYDVNLDKRLRYPLYWEEGVSVVRRCTWFYKGDGGSKLVPYMEDMAARLEVILNSYDVVNVPWIVVA